MESVVKIKLSQIDAFIKDLDDDEAVIYMVDSNIHREKILPSEKAFAHKMKMDALKHQGKKTYGTECHKSRDILTNNSPDCSRQIQNYVRLYFLLTTSMLYLVF